MKVFDLGPNRHHNFRSSPRAMINYIFSSDKTLHRWNITQLLNLSNFSKWRPSARNRPRLDGLYRCAKFGWYRPTSILHKEVVIFCDFCLKMPIRAPFGLVSEIWPPSNEAQWKRIPQQLHVYMFNCPTICYKKILIPPKNRVTFPWTFSQSLILENFVRHFERCKVLSMCSLDKDGYSMR